MRLNKFTKSLAIWALAASTAFFPHDVDAARSKKKNINAGIRTSVSRYTAKLDKKNQDLSSLTWWDYSLAIKSDWSISAINPSYRINSASAIKLATAYNYLNMLDTLGFPDWRPFVQFWLIEKTDWSFDLYIKSFMANLSGKDILSVVSDMKNSWVKKINSIYFDPSYLPERVICTPWVIDSNDSSKRWYKTCQSHLIIDWNIDPKTWFNPWINNDELAYLASLFKGDIDPSDEWEISLKNIPYLDSLAKRLEGYFQSRKIKISDTSYHEAEYPKWKLDISLIKRELDSPREKIKRMLKVSDNMTADQLFLLTWYFYWKRWYSSLDIAQNVCNELSQKNLWISSDYFCYWWSWMSWASFSSEVVKGAGVTAIELMNIAELFVSKYRDLLPEKTRFWSMVYAKTWTTNTLSSLVWILKNQPFAILGANLNGVPKNEFRRRALSLIKMITKPSATLIAKKKVRR